MSYESQSTLPAGTSLDDVCSLVELLGYRRISPIPHSYRGELRRFGYYDEADYRSYTGVLLSISHSDTAGELVVSTRTPVARSYYDLEQQNNTIRLLRKHFGGAFVTDAGKGRYFRAESEARSPPQSGCHLAFQRFGSNLIKADVYLMYRVFSNKEWHQTGIFDFVDAINPRLLSNNLLLPYIVAVLEEYFKSTFVALLKYSERKAGFFKGNRLSADHLSRISSGITSVEQAIVEMLPFQRISTIW